MDFDDLDIANRLIVAEEEAAQALLHIREFQAPVPVLIERQNSSTRQELNELLQGWAGFLDEELADPPEHHPPDAVAAAAAVPTAPAAPTASAIVAVPVAATAAAAAAAVVVYPPVMMAARFNAAPRTDAQVNAAFATIAGADRTSLDADVLAKHRAAAVAALGTKFSLLPLNTDDATLVNNYNLAMRVQDFTNRLDRYAMAELFHGMVLLDATGQPIPGADVNLLEAHSTITLAQVRASTHFFRYNALQHFADDCIWSLELLENSTESDFRDKVNEQMMNFDHGEQGGLVFFWVMMSIIQSSTEDAIRGLEAKIQLLKIRDTPGKNVGTAVGKLRLNIKRLADANRLPIDILIWLENIFQTMSVPEFNKVFEAIGTNRRLGIVGPQPTTVHSLLTLAETTFNEFFSLGKWPTSSSGASSFLQTQVKKTPICWNCGTSGHTVKQCTKPANAAAQAKAKAEFLKKKKENQTSSSSSTKTKTKDKGADSGGGGGGSGNRSNSNSNSSGKTVRPVLSQDYPQTRRPGRASDKRQHFNGVLHEW
jgi:uncharacterized membrane protein YgcG